MVGSAHIYVDTSVISGCLQDVFSEWSNRLVDEFREGRKVPVVSDLTRLEVERGPKEVQEVLAGIDRLDVRNIGLGEESLALADCYIKEGIVTIRHLTDAQHIAIATVERIDVLVSWNFRHIVNLNRIHAFNGVNLIQGYPLLEIRSPQEVLHEREDR